MGKFENLDREKKKEAVELLSNWLSMYTGRVVVEVMEHAEEIISNEFVMNLLRELYKREQREKNDFKNSIESLLENYDNFKEFDPHNNPLEHSNSYRDVLYDMYIR